MRARGGAGTREGGARRALGGAGTRALGGEGTRALGGAGMRTLGGAGGAPGLLAERMLGGAGTGRLEAGALPSRPAAPAAGARNRGAGIGAPAFFKSGNK